MGFNITHSLEKILEPERNHLYVSQKCANSSSQQPESHGYILLPDSEATFTLDHQVFLGCLQSFIITAGVKMEETILLSTS
jgi:hypothetical protein